MDETDAKHAARRVGQVLGRFLSGIAEHTTTGEFEQLLFGHRGLDEIGLGYKPEAYTRFNLVEPLLRAVGCDYQLEPRSSRIERDQWPDFELTNTVVPYIGEVKPLNDLGAGEEQVREYLTIGGFRSPYAILTDGVEWMIYGPPGDNRGGASAVECLHFSLADSIRTVASTEGYWDGSCLSSDRRTNGTDRIEEFPRVFSPNRIDTWSLHRLPPGHRNEFPIGERSLQVPLDTTWE